MSQYHHNGRRPHQRRNRNINYNNYSGSRFNKPHFIHERDDDQIAPSSVSASTQKLQQWALATADLIQQPTKRHKSRVIEDELRERIQQRYECPEEYRATPSENSNSPTKNRSVIDLTGDEEPFSSLKSGTTNKRPARHHPQDPPHVPTSARHAMSGPSSELGQGRPLRWRLPTLPLPSVHIKRKRSV
ncbi:hypothetical protein P3342_009321 [Pyrenophora teres f. teres]|nr:hypothetical protein P3342_009321 [Pyrenophora teres f. teres]